MLDYLGVYFHLSNSGCGKTHDDANYVYEWGRGEAQVQLLSTEGL
jgi:hypothetical protein